MDRQTQSQTERQAKRCQNLNREAERQTDSQVDRQTDVRNLTDRQAERQMLESKQTDRHKQILDSEHTYIHADRQVLADRQMLELYYIDTQMLES